MNYDLRLHESIIYWIWNEHNSLNMEELMKKKFDQNQIDRIKLKIEDEITFKFEKNSSIKHSFHFSKKNWLIRFTAFSSFVIQMFKITKTNFWRKQTSCSTSSVCVTRNLNFINEMIELKNWRNEISINLKNLKVNKIDDISTHVILSESEHYYVNNYVNWDTYNIIRWKFLEEENQTSRNV
jgi:hypothetical protein